MQKNQQLFQALPVQEFLASTGELKAADPDTIYLFDPRRHAPESDSIVVSHPSGGTDFPIPLAAIEHVVPLGLAGATDPTRQLIAISFRPEFQSLGTAFREMKLRRFDNPPPELCPPPGDQFLGEPGKFSNVGIDAPPSGQYVRINFQALNTNTPQCVLIRQGAGAERLVAKFFYGLLTDPRVTASFTSNGGDIQFEFQQFIGNRWYPYYNTIELESTEPHTTVVLRDGGTAQATVEWGSGIAAPPQTTPAFLQIAGKSKCEGFIWKVQTSYAYAWLTSTPDPNGPRVVASNISVRFQYQGCRPAVVQNSAQNSSQVEASEQVHGADPICGICFDYIVSAEALLPDGRRLTNGGLRIHPD